MTADWRIAADSPIEVEDDPAVQRDREPDDGYPPSHPRDRYSGRPVEQDEL